MMGEMRIEGLPAMERTLVGMRRAVRRLLKDGALAGAEVIRDEARAIAPRSGGTPAHGHLADHIEMKAMRATQTECVVHIGPDERHYYGRFQEHGTRKMAAQPFLRPAIDNKEREALEAFSKSVKGKLL